MTLKTIDIGGILGYSVSALTLAMGMAVFSGMLVSEQAPAQLRYTFGTVLILMSLYRFVLTRSRAMQRRREEGDV